MRRFSAFFLCLVLCLSLFPRYAFAAANDEVPTVIWSGYLDDGYYGVLASAENRYDAAVVALGYNPALLSSEVRSKLSDVNYGGNFYKYATTFDEVSSAAEYPEWVPAYVSIGNIISDYWHFGTGFPPWKSRATNTLYTNALIDLKLVLSGEDLGGGGSAVTGYTEYDLMCCEFYDPDASASAVQNAYFNAVSASIDSSGNVSAGSAVTKFSFYTNSPYYASTARCYLPPSVQSYINDVVSNGKKVVVNVGNIMRSQVNYAQLYVADDFNIVRQPDANGVERYVFYMTNGYYWSVTNNTPNYYDSEGLFFVFPDATPTLTPVQSRGEPMYYASPIISPTYDPPSGTWPEPATPVTPTAPELPEPASPTVETPVTPTVPAPVWPDITINIEPDPTPGTTPSGLDYTELLTRINDNLISIDSFARAINSNLNSLRSDLLAEFNGVIGSLRNIYSYLLTIDSVLETHCTHLRNKMEESAVFIANYMRTLIKWLADQLDFDDLTNVEAPDNSLLTTINEKLGGGTYEPNPIKDEQGYYQWLDDLWDRFLLGDNWQSSMGSISGSFNELKTRFPFSIPWDVVALFRLFVHDPVTPVFDLPLYFSSDGSTPVHVDLTPWDSVAAVVRPLVFVIFALKLALLSRDLLGGLGADKGGL